MKYTPEEIAKFADGYYAGNADWANRDQEIDTKVGWRMGFAYAMNQLDKSPWISVTERMPACEEEDGFVSETVFVLSKDGYFFVDNAEKGEDGMACFINTKNAVKWMPIPK